MGSWNLSQGTGGFKIRKSINITTILNGINENTHSHTLMITSTFVENVFEKVTLFHNKNNETTRKEVNFHNMIKSINKNPTTSFMLIVKD